MNYKGNRYTFSCMKYMHIKIKEYRIIQIKKWVPQNVAPLKQSHEEFGVYLREYILHIFIIKL